MSANICDIILCCNESGDCIRAFLHKYSGPELFIR